MSASLISRVREVQRTLLGSNSPHDYEIKLLFGEIGVSADAFYELYQNATLLKLKASNETFQKLVPIHVSFLSEVDSFAALLCLQHPPRATRFYSVARKCQELLNQALLIQSELIEEGPAPKRRKTSFS